MKAKSALIFIVSLAIIIFTSAVAYNGLGDNNYLGAKDINLGLDLAGGVSITYEAVKENPTDEEMDGAKSIIQTRLDYNNYTEAKAYREGKNRIKVEIPGVEDSNKAVDDIGKTAMLRFVGIDSAKLQKQIEEEFKKQQEELEKEENKEQENEESSQEEQTTNTDSTKDENKEEENSFEKFIEESIEKGMAEEVITGVDVKNSTFQKGQIDQYSGIQPYVKLELNEEGKEKFANGTKKFLGQVIVILLDNQPISWPQVNTVIDDGVATISGMRDDAEAKKLANDIRGGALPVELEAIESNGVGAELGRDAIDTSLLAGLIGGIVVLLFMAIYYKIPGIAADLALIFYASLLIILISAFNLTLTLPGIAGIILSIGMAVDANIIIFARIREELRSGKGLRASIDHGFKKALSAIVDGNVTTLIASAVLWFLGTGPIKGFAQTLALGIVVSMFTALVVTRILLKQFIQLGSRNPKLYGAK